MLFEMAFLARGKTEDSGLATMTAGDSRARMRSEDGGGLEKSSVVFGCSTKKKKKKMPGWLEWTGEEVTKWNWHLL